MNNWRLLLLAVVAVLQPIGSFTERNLIDGRQECCDHRSNSFTQETRVHGNSRKSFTEDRRLNSEDIREDRRRSDARDDPIRSRERVAVERTERRISPECAAKFDTETRFAREQDRRQRSAEARESRLTREFRGVQSRRIRESISKDTLRRYERDALDSRRYRMSRDDTRIGRVNNERVSEESNDVRRVRHSENFRRISVVRAVADRRGREDVIRDQTRRDFRIGTSRRNLDEHVRDSAEENRRSRSLESRANGVERQNRRTNFRTISEERTEERRQRDLNRESKDRTVVTLRDSSERIYADRRRESRDTVERVEQNRRNIREYRTEARVDVQRQHRDDNRLSREKSRESRILDANVRTENNFRSEDRTDARRARDISRETRTSTTNVRTRKSDETRVERRQPLTKSLVQERSNERVFAVRSPVRDLRQERSVRYRRDVRSDERLDEQREQRRESRMPRERYISVFRETRDHAERRQETRSVSPSRSEVNTRFEREHRLRERDNVRSDLNRREREEGKASRAQTLNRLARNTASKRDRQLSRNSLFTERANSEERISRTRDEVNRERVNVREARDKNNARNIVSQRPTRNVSAPQRSSDTRRIESNTLLQRSRTLESIRNERRELTGRDERSALRDRTSISRLSRETFERREAKGTAKDSRDRSEIIRNREIRMTAKSETRRQQDDSRSQDRVLQRDTRNILSARSAERKSREIRSRDVEMRSERLARNRDARKNGEDRSNGRQFRSVETRRETRRMMESEVQPNRRNLATERMDRTTNRASRDIRIESKMRSDIVLAKEIRGDTRREARNTRFRIFEAKFREIDPVDGASDNENTISWQMVFYTLQGAYLCGLLMHLLTEKSTNGKPRNFTAWWSSPKSLVKVD